MNPTARYNAALLLHNCGYDRAVNYIRQFVGGCLIEAIDIADEIVENGQ